MFILGKNSERDIDRRKSEEAPRDGGSVAYISETSIKQITKEDKLDLITSLTINFPKDKLNKKIKVMSSTGARNFCQFSTYN